jgi:hypothetical protein
LYDTLLDHDLEDEVVVADGDVELDAKELDEVDDDDRLSLDLPEDVKDDAAAALEFDDEAPEGESWSDDPVRMYLTQMGEIPLLTRQQEISIGASCPSTARCRFPSPTVWRRSKSLAGCRTIWKRSISFWTGTPRTTASPRPRARSRPAGRRPGRISPSAAAAR